LLKEWLTSTGIASAENPIFQLESGARFRDFITKDTYTSSLSKKIYDKGGLQPAFLPVWIWGELFVENLKGNEHIILDGTPRTLPEAIVLDTAMEFYKREKPIIFHIDISKEEAKKRLKLRGRLDDLEDSDVEERLSWFDTQVIPAFEFFKNKPDNYQAITINGEQSIEAVFEEIKSHLA
jgi:adenylate kinase family enzyme